MSKTTDTALSFLVGAVAGGIAGILLAPDKGTKTRNKIKRKSVRLKEQGIKKAQQATALIQEETENRIDQAKEVANQIQDVANHQVSAIKEAVVEGKTTYEKKLADSKTTSK